jgi:hypothetical protein
VVGSVHLRGDYWVENNAFKERTLHLTSAAIEGISAREGAYRWVYKYVREFKCIRPIGWKKWWQTKNSRFTQDPELFSTFWNHRKVDKDHTHLLYKLLWIIRV